VQSKIVHFLLPASEICTMYMLWRRKTHPEWWIWLAASRPRMLRDAEWRVPPPNSTFRSCPRVRHASEHL